MCYNEAPEYYEDETERDQPEEPEEDYITDDMQAELDSQAEDKYFNN